MDQYRCWHNYIYNRQSIVIYNFITECPTNTSIEFIRWFPYSDSFVIGGCDQYNPSVRWNWGQIIYPEYKRQMIQNEWKKKQLKCITYQLEWPTNNLQRFGGFVILSRLHSRIVPSRKKYQSKKLHMDHEQTSRVPRLAVIKLGQSMIDERRLSNEGDWLYEWRTLTSSFCSGSSLMFSLQTIRFWKTKRETALVCPLKTLHWCWDSFANVSWTGREPVWSKDEKVGVFLRTVEGWMRNAIASKGEDPAICMNRNGNSSDTLPILQDQWSSLFVVYQNLAKKICSRIWALTQQHWQRRLGFPIKNLLHWSYIERLFKMFITWFL